MKAEQIVVALDGMDRQHALSLAWSLSSSVWGFKVNDLLLSEGVQIIKDLKRLGKVFADPKLHDTPRTVAHSANRLSAAGADIITVHASGGKEMIKAALDNSSKIIAVTLLTSTDDQTSQETYLRSAEETVWDLAHLAYDAGAHGIVCSPQEVSLLEHLNFMKVTPGIRIHAVENDDQKRTGLGKADLYVIGRPITQARDPLLAIKEMTNESN